MIYGIKHDNGKIAAITRFRGALPAGFDLITKAQYDSFIGIVSNNTFVSYNAAKESIDVDEAAESNLINSQQKENIKGNLRALSIEIDLLARMGESTVAKQTEFDALLIEYNRSI